MKNNFFPFFKLSQLFLLVVVLAFFSCNKDEDSPNVETETSDVADDLSDMEFDPEEPIVEGEFATESFQVLIQEDSYCHFYQINAKRCGGRACLPTTYMMLRKMVYPDRECSREELDKIMGEIGIDTRDGCDNPGSKFRAIWNLAPYAGQDIGACQPNHTSGHVTTNRELAKDRISSWLNKGLPILGLITSRKNGTPDLNGGYRHWVGIVGLDFKVGGTGSVVYYINSMSTIAKIYKIDYTLFLDAMKAASPEKGNYNIFPIGCEEDGIVPPGPQYTEMTTTNTSNFRSVDFLPNGEVSAIATSPTNSNDNFRVYHSTDFGLNWTIKSTSSIDIPYKRVNLQFMDNNIAYLNVDNGLAKTINGGDNFSKIASSLDVFQYSFPSVSVGYIVEHNRTLSKTINGGVSWTTLLNASDAIDMFDSGLIKNIEFADENLGFACTREDIYRTNNGGAGWTKIASDITSRLEDIHVVTSSVIYACGSELFKSSDGGDTWIGLNIPNYPNLELRSIDFIDANNGFVVGEYDDSFGVILHTTDGGVTWEEKIYDGLSFHDVSMYDINTAIIVGGKPGSTWQTLGKIIRYALPE